MRCVVRYCIDLVILLGKGVIADVVLVPRIVVHHHVLLLVLMNVEAVIDVDLAIRKASRCGLLDGSASSYSGQELIVLPWKMAAVAPLRFKPGNILV